MQLLNSKILSNDKNTRYSNKKAQDTQYLVLFVCCSFFVQQRWWTEVDSNHRSLRRQIYSLIHLAALESVRIWCSASCGAGDWTWTHNLLITNQLLCQLSYTGVWCLEVESNHRQKDFQSFALPTELSRQMATQTRLELVTSSVTGWRSNQTELLGLTFQSASKNAWL